MRVATDSLSATILRLQGNGDYDGVKAFMQKYGSIDAQLRADLDRLSSAGIPVDIVFEQGTNVLGPDGSTP
jgi:predicted DNA-binding transcriptional regulator YafY